VKLIATLPSKIFPLKFIGCLVWFVTSGIFLIFITQEDLDIFWNYFYSSSLYRFLLDTYFIFYEADSLNNSDNSTKKEEEAEKKSEESADENQKSKTANQYFKPETSTIIKGGLIVGTIIGVATLIYKIFFKNGK